MRHQSNIRTEFYKQRFLFVRRKRDFCLLLLFFLCCRIQTFAHDCPTLRRPISPSQPVWIIHIDVWNYADPQKIIDMVPEDVRPFVVFNISTSSNDEKSANGPAIYDSWMKVCAQNRVWTMIQCASGAVNRLPDDGSTQKYEQYFKDYPNFIGYNFAEQFWGFGDEGRVDFPTRLQLFADLLPLCHQYGGYLAVSFTDSYYNSSKMPIAYLKRNQQISDFLQSDPEHFLCFEKYTLKKNFYDIESGCLGHWLGGYAGQYGIRFDCCGWLTADDVTDQTKGGSPFVRAAGAIPIAEHVMLTGETMIDGPELTWSECSQETNTSNVDGYTSRNWSWFPQFENISLDMFRRILDGTIRIPSRQEVINRTKVCIVNDINRNINSESEHDSYITPETLFDGLYRSEQDRGGAPNNWIANRWWMKTTGRYPTIPLVYTEVEGMKCLKKSQFSKTDFDKWMNDSFVAEYTGDIYAGRHENGWVTYNPYQYEESVVEGYRICKSSSKRASGCIPFQYNSCDSVHLDYAPYTLGILKEFNDSLFLYINNYQTTGVISEDIIKISGVLNQPTVKWNDSGNHTASTVTSTWSGGILTICVRHNGPVCLSVACSGGAVDRKTTYTTSSIVTPDLPPVYEGTLQYEAEVADYRNTTIRKSGYNYGRDGYYGQGFAELSTQSSSLRFSVCVPKSGYYLVTLRYQTDLTGSATINGKERIQLPKTSTWSLVSAPIHLSKGSNNIILQNDTGSNLYADCILIDPVSTVAFTPDSSGEYHVRLSDLTTSGSISINPGTGVVSQTNNSNVPGYLRLFFNEADFSDVVSVQVDYEGDGDIFRYLLITDNEGVSVNPSGSMGAFWSSKYSLDYHNYQTVAASNAVSMLEWAANTPVDIPRTMTIKDIVIKIRTTSTDIISPPKVSSLSDTYYDLRGHKYVQPRQGIYLIKTKEGKTIKIRK